MTFCRLLFFFKINFLEKFLQGYNQNNQIWIQIDQNRQNVGPDLDPNFLKRFSVDDTGRLRPGKRPPDKCVIKN